MKTCKVWNDLTKSVYKFIYILHLTSCLVTMMFIVDD